MRDEEHVSCYQLILIDIIWYCKYWILAEEKEWSEMGFLFVNTVELSALMGLPYIQQSAYLLGIRPYMDRETF